MTYWDAILQGELTDDDITALEGFSVQWFKMFSQLIRCKPISYLEIINELNGSDDGMVSRLLGLGSFSGLKPGTVSQKFLEIEAVQFEEFLARWDSLKCEYNLRKL